MIDEEAKEATARKMPFKWKGMTIFYQKKLKPQNVLYFDTPSGIAKAKINEDDLEWFQTELALLEQESRLRESCYLRLRQRGKELDPRDFDAKEKKAFGYSGQK